MSERSEFLPRVTFTQAEDARLFFDALNTRYAFNPPASGPERDDMLDLLIAVHAEWKRLSTDTEGN